MLVLMRKLGQKIMIGDNIEITVTDIGRGQIRLGIMAPRDVPILRKELWDAQQVERRNNEYDTIPE
jgi:carbon storage regulator